MRPQKAAQPDPKPRIIVSVAPEPPQAPPPVPPQSYVEDLGGGVKLEMVYIPGGSFLMGSLGGLDTGSYPEHRVNLKPFFIGKYQITQAQWKAVMGDKKKLFGLVGGNPSKFKGDDLPVERVSWEDAQKFCEVISQHTGKTYRLPSEAEWEYACRAKSVGSYCFGDAESLLEQYAWYSDNSGSTTHPVGQKKPNAWGLHDMHGNVWEWCEDVWHDSYSGQHGNPPIDGSAWLSGGDSSRRVLRGGSWNTHRWSCVSANRGHIALGDRLDNDGFRLVRALS